MCSLLFMHHFSVNRETVSWGISVGMWLLEKIRNSVESSGTHSKPPQTTEAIPVSVYANVLTPEKIPDFFIPPKLICCPPEESLSPEPQYCSTLRPSSSDHAICSQSPRARSSKNPCSPRLFSRLGGDTRNLQKSANRHIIQIESADEPGAADRVSTEVNTNADPQSQTAMSLPYVPKAQTSYGFSTLVESPHTRRKESLFHSDPSSPLTSPNSQRRSQGGTLLAPADPNPYRYFSGGESDTCSSAESSPFNSPLLSRSASLLRSITQGTQAKVRTISARVCVFGSAVIKLLSYKRVFPQGFFLHVYQCFCLSPTRWLVPSAPWHATVLSPLMTAAQLTTAPTCSAATCVAPHLLPSVDVKKVARGARRQTSCSASTLSTSTRGGHWGLALTMTGRHLGWGSVCSQLKPFMTGRQTLRASTAV